MAPVNRVIAAKAKKAEKGGVKKKVKEEKVKFPVGPVLMGFLLFVVVGSALLQVLRNAQASQPFGGGV
ncbi:unnamed protein product [Pedinophyceae sp. YPF-701]|nr:unnamed protein product [Pedinophyceae sp. YPF-701]